MCPSRTEKNWLFCLIRPAQTNLMFAEQAGDAASALGLINYSRGGKDAGRNCTPHCIAWLRLVHRLC